LSADYYSYHSGAFSMAYESTHLQTNGVQLHIVTAGPENGQPVILLHGFPEFWYGWREQIPVLAEAGYRIIVPDQRGYNLSDKPEGVKSYRVDALAGDILGLIDALGYDKVHLVGHDWGAIVAWSFAILHPKRLHKLGILNVPHPAVMNQFLRRDKEQKRKSWYIFFFQLPWLPEFFLRSDDWRNSVRMLLGSSKRGSFSKDDILKYKKAWAQPGAISSMINWYRASRRYPPRMPKKPRVSVPTLVLWGKQDVALSHRMAQPSIDYCDEGKLIFFEDATHWVQHDKADEVNRLLLDFLK